MSVSYDLWVDIENLTTTASPSSAYLYQMIYVAKGTADLIFTLFSKEDVDFIPELDPLELPRIKRGFDFGMAKIFLAITTDFDAYDLTLYGNTKNTAIAFTTVVSPDFEHKAIPPDSGVFVFHKTLIPTGFQAPFECTVFDVLKEGLGIGVFASFLTQQTFTNLQFKPFSPYSAVDSDGVASSLLDTKTTFVFLDDAESVLLGMFTVGGKATADIYINELWELTVQNELISFLQIHTPAYINENIVVLEAIVNKVSKQFQEIYGLGFTPALAPRRENQLATDVDNFKVAGISTTLTYPSAIWRVGVITKEA